MGGRRQSTRVEESRIESAHLPAPIGGINRADPASAMPGTDAIHLYNLLAAELGLEVRPGWPEHVTGITGVCRVQVPFTGTASNGSADRIWQATTEGLYNVSSSSTSPTLTVTFGTQAGAAGRGVSTAFTTLAGRFCLYADEVNGLYTYSENSGTWAKVTLGGAAWQPSTDYVAGNRVTNAGNVYVCDTNGASAGSGGPTGNAADIVDGSTRWDYVASAATAIGPSLADQRAGFEGNPANFASVTIFKNRPWLVEKDSTAAWYGPLNGLYGEYTRFDFGQQMRVGGDLRGLFNWSYDGGNGLDTLLVGLSGGGDVVIYGGTDPASANTFGLKGVWFVGTLPAGRRVATDFGGELLALSTLGLVPLSKLVAGGSIEDQSLFATRKIQPLFNELSRLYRSVPGWAVTVHPEKNCLLVTVPTEEDEPVRIFAMAFSAKGWAEWRDIPMTACASWNGTLFFGTDDGRVGKNTGTLDEVLLSDPDSSTEIDYSLLGAYQNLGNARQKQIQLVEPILLSDSAAPNVEAWAKYDFDLTEPSPPTGASGAASDTAVFGTAIFGLSVFGGSNTVSQPYFGGAGIGKHVAIAIRGKANSKTTIVGMNVSYTQGGLL